MPTPWLSAQVWRGRHAGEEAEREPPEGGPRRRAPRLPPGPRRGWDTRKEWKDILSGREKQRIAIARLLYHEPQFAVIDEGTSAVSSDVEGLLYETCKERGISELPS